MRAGAGPRFEVRVVDGVLAEDLNRCSRAARIAIEPLVAEIRRDGVPFEWLRRYEKEGHDGTRLGGCVKFYIPRPAGQWGAVLAGDEEGVAWLLIAAFRNRWWAPGNDSAADLGPDSARRMHPPTGRDSGP